MKGAGMDERQEEETAAPFYDNTEKEKKRKSSFFLACSREGKWFLWEMSGAWEKLSFFLARFICAGGWKALGRNKNNDFVDGIIVESPTTLWLLKLTQNIGAEVFDIDIHSRSYERGGSVRCTVAEST